jgi:hypothetical protein
MEMSLTTARGIPTTVDACITVVREELSLRLGGAPLSADVDQIVEREVERLWANPIKTFIPVLAVRAAWETMLAVRAQGAPTSITEPAPDLRRHDSDLMPHHPNGTLTHQATDRLVWDRRDDLLVDRRDVLRPD